MVEKGRPTPRWPRETSATDQWSPIGFRFSAYLSVDAQLEVSTRQSVSPLSELTLMPMSARALGVLTTKVRNTVGW